MIKNPMTTLVYLEKDDCYLMLHRVTKKNDVNKDKWIGVGGHFEEGESPEECAARETKEETGLTPANLDFRGIVTFTQEGYGTEYMCLFTCTDFTGEMKTCDEGVLEWVSKDKLGELNLWEGDYIFLDLLEKDEPFFSLKLTYKKDKLDRAVLNGRLIK